MRLAYLTAASVWFFFFAAFESSIEAKPDARRLHRANSLSVPRARLGHQVLGDVERRVRMTARQGRRPVVLFDVDNTLFDSTRRIERVLRALGWKYNVKGLKRFTSRPTDKLDQLPAFVCREVTDGEKLQALRKDFADQYDKLSASPKLDHPIPGAQRCVQALKAAGATVVYLTGRSDRYFDATCEILRQKGFPAPEPHGFSGPIIRLTWSTVSSIAAACEARVMSAMPAYPAARSGLTELGRHIRRIQTRLGLPLPALNGAPVTALMMRPDAEADTHAFKKRMLPEIEKLGTVVAAFDDSVTNCGLYGAAFPEAKIVRVNHNYLDPSRYWEVPDLTSHLRRLPSWP